MRRVFRFLIPMMAERLSKQQKVPIYVYEEANHSIETPDTMKNLELLTDVMEKTKRYIHLFEIIQ